MKKMDVDFIADGIQLSLVLEVCSEKPGNVTPTRGFHDTDFRDFILGALALKPVLEKAVARGVQAGAGKTRLSRIGVGGLIKESVLSVKKAHSGGNTHLGAIMLLVPAAAGAGFCVGRKESGLESLCRSVRMIMENTTVDDSVFLFDAVNLARAGGLGREDRMDVRKTKSKNIILKEKIRLIDLMRYSSGKDSIASELSCGMPKVFNEGVPELKKNLEKLKDVRKAVVQTYLHLLSKHPDTLIARKNGIEMAVMVSKKAAEVLRLGGVSTKEGEKAIERLDGLLRGRGNRLNPGTTADLTTASLAVFLMEKINSSRVS